MLHTLHLKKYFPCCYNTLEATFMMRIHVSIYYKTNIYQTFQDVKMATMGKIVVISVVIAEGPSATKQGLVHSNVKMAGTETNV